jgi:hypothetical protein
MHMDDNIPPLPVNPPPSHGPGSQLPLTGNVIVPQPQPPGSSSGYSTTPHAPPMPQSPQMPQAPRMNSPSLNPAPNLELPPGR